MAAKQRRPDRVAAANRRARHNYHIEEVVEAGIVLTGSEVKSLRGGEADIVEAYAQERGGELYLINAYIPEYHAASQLNHEPRRARKLLVNKRELGKLAGAKNRQGMTLVPLAIYFTVRGLAKVELAVARGKKLYDKRAATKERDWERSRARLLREKG